MCGIAGFVGAGNKGDLAAMGDLLTHRGPDGVGVYADDAEHVFLIHRRLSIIDIDGGAQPMWNEDKSICVIFNGEIYNHRELRKELCAKGHVFGSDHSDTEVLVHGYEEWGEELPLLLNGMFAFAIYDKNRGRVFLARDRFGKKPLYFTQKRDTFAFASELTALLKHSALDDAIDVDAVKKYFAYGFIPAPLSLYRNVKKLPGGCSLMYSLATRRIRERRYWEFKIEPFDEIPQNPIHEWGEQIITLLGQAVKRRLMSDVPLGIFLSGGIDSSAVLALAAASVRADQIKTFSIGFTEASYDESRYAREVAELFGTEHHEQVLSIDRARELIPTVLGKLDEPMGDPSILPTYLLSAFARERVTVALGGDGGDELFAGYDPFKALKLAEYYRKFVPRPIHLAARRLAEWIPKSDRNMSWDLKVRRGLRGMSFPPSTWNPAWLGALEPQDIADLLHEKADYEDVYSEAIHAWETSKQADVIDRSLEFYTKFYLQDDILTKVDRASMMVSLEVRAPFLDNDLVDFVRRVPNSYKYRNGQTKYLLKTAVEKLLPKEIIYRKKKGFGIPLSRWLREMDDAELDANLPNANRDWVSRRWHEHRSGDADHRQFLWSWLVLQHHVSRGERLCSL